ncbi:hypothetical protein N8726_00125 [Pelagibacteraceae bacterium]|jgi:hypothetical protein|nr:hypothetical protein [Pelagibacteraceae bacterium]
MIILFNVLVVVILGIVLFLGLRAISVGLAARSKTKRAKPTRKRKR